MKTPQEWDEELIEKQFCKLGKTGRLLEIQKIQYDAYTEAVNALKECGTGLILNLINRQPKERTS
jgi:hypothetical protein